MLVAAALTLTACNGGGSGSSHSSRSHSAKKSGKVKNGKRIKKSSKTSNSGCSTSTNGRKVIWVNNVEGAMNNIIAKNAKRRCNTTSQQGTYQAVGALHTYSVASGGSKVTIISRKDSAQKALTAQNGGIAHIKTCADPKGRQYDGGQAKADAGDCWGLNFYEIKVDSNGKITEMTEIYAS